MAADVVFDGDWVRVEGNWTKLTTLDLMLDAPSRRIEQTGKRRALVHDHGDRLTINYNGDYPNGVRIVGSTSADSLYVEHMGKFGHGIVTPSVLLGPASPPPTYTPGGPPPGGGAWGIDVGDALSSLQRDVAALHTEVANLKTKLAALEP